MKNPRTGNGHAEASAGDAAGRLTSFIKTQMKRKGIRGLSLAVADGSGTLWSAGFGLADGTGKRAFDATTISSLGSVSKLITATAVMRLVQEGKIDLDAPVSRYLPDFQPGDGGYGLSAVTVRLLLSHHSGLQSDVFRGFSLGPDRPDGYPRLYADNASLASKTTLCAAPGSVMSYSNLGFSLLGLMVEKVSGKDFAVFVREIILDPLGMDSSSFLFDERLASRYAQGKAGRRTNVSIPYIRDLPAGAFLSTAEDMGKFLSAVISSAKGASRGPLEPPIQREMWRRQNEAVALDLDFSIGLGWWLTGLSSLPGESLVLHGGDLDPFCAFLVVSPARSLGVFVMATSVKGFGSLTLGDGIAAQALREFAALRGGPPVREKPAAPAPAPMPRGLAAALAGDYATPLGLVSIKPRGKVLAVKTNGKWVQGYYRTDGSFGLRAKVLGIELPIPILKELSLSPERLGDETAIAFRTLGISMGVGRRAAPFAPSPAWLARVGVWVPTERETAPEIRRASLSLDRATGLFLLNLRFQMGELAHPLRPTSDREAVLQGSGRNLGTTIRVTCDGAVETLTAFGVSFRKR
jgi:CubicO group peptidase (beta-lactamase class C family)